MLDLWPVFEFRPLPRDELRDVLRYADGAWLPDDGEHDIAFVVTGFGAPLGLYVRLPYQRNIIWSGLTQHWSTNNPEHPRANPWHYMLRDGATEWGGDWGSRQHLNGRAGDAAMSKCCSMMRCANGRGPEFKLDDPYIAAGLVRDRETKQVVTFPERPICMFCGGAWARKREQLARDSRHSPNGRDAKQARGASPSGGGARSAIALPTSSLTTQEGGE